jgi:hypothetical protein
MNGTKSRSSRIVRDGPTETTSPNLTTCQCSGRGPISVSRRGETCFAPTWAAPSATRARSLAARGAGGGGWEDF